MRSYEEVLNIIENSRRFENRLGVEITGIALDKLGHPERDIPFIHVAGTNGKGSTCAFLNSIFLETGLKVGVFTSPHLIDFEERITIGPERISREDVRRLGNQLLDIDFGVRLTMFDYCLLMAILYFREQSCDLMIMETGLGGRLDSTNALGLPLVAAISKIGFDHMAFLGNSLTEIASEKAGIMKAGCPVFVESQEPSVEKVFKDRASELQLEDFYIISERQIDSMREKELGLKGLHQYENAALAAAVARKTLEVYKSADNIDIDDIIDKGLRMAHWPGRMELLSKEPFVMVDGAHNSNGVAALKDSLISMYPGEKFHFVMGVMADKDYPEMVKLLLPYAYDFVTVTPESSRALQAEELADFVKSQGVSARGLSSVEEAIRAFSKEGKNIVFGSLYFVGELKAKFN